LVRSLLSRRLRRPLLTLWLLARPSSRPAAIVCANALAFTPLTVPKHSVRSPVMETKEDLVALAKELNPVVGFWDPMGLADGEFWGDSNEATIGFLRHAEVQLEHTAQQ
jgi:hypothetical protein